MNKLKTLKDITNLKNATFVNSKDYKSGKTGDIFVSQKDLKQEAIKWIKELKTEKCMDCGSKKIDKIFDYSCMACSEGCGMCGTDIIISFIKHFFNITEEDL